jgi:UDP-N-acetyl-D-glucosamine dehydrogenase
VAKVGVCGLGYVGLPLALAMSRAGFSTVGFDIDSDKIRSVNLGKSYIGAVKSPALGNAVNSGKLRATGDCAEFGDCDVIIICVPTPLTRHREPDLSYIEATAVAIAEHLRRAQLVVLESTTYPGTTQEVLVPLLERGGLRCGQDFFVGFSPEREDPGNPEFDTSSIPKVVSGEGPEACALVEELYRAAVEKVVPVSSTATAEAVKITENIFRAVNIALVNELKMIFTAMDIDIWEVIDAAKTKPFGFMAFYPGPGLGGHCIPIDPFYLTWKSREYEIPTRFVELAGEINVTMPRYVIGRLEEALDTRQGLPLSRARVLLVGLAYKKNVSDIRESPSLKLIELLERRGAKVEFHDPHVAGIPATREHPEFNGRRSVPLTVDTLRGYDAVIIATDHDAVDYALVASSPLVIDTRNALANRGLTSAGLVKA